jgi:uncharacterized protein (DUF2141 family)
VKANLAILALLTACEGAPMRAGARVDQEAAARESTFAGLEVSIDGLRGSSGQVVCNLYESAASYEAGRALASAVVEAGAAPLVARFPRLAAGSYGVVCFHDEDRDARLATNLVGMPREGVGCSNGAKGGVGHGPRFGDMRLDYRGGKLVVPVSLRYL